MGKIVKPALAIVGALALGAAGFTALSAHKPEIVEVKYRGATDLSSFDCTDVARSSFIERVCFDRRRSEMVISLKGVYYAYCAIPAGTVDSLLVADSMGRFYNSQIKGRFACR